MTRKMDMQISWYYYLIMIYIAAVNIFAAAITVHDKNAARRHRWRVPESTLLLTAALSGCVVMYATMHLIHHKTKHPKFMIGIPLIFIAELAVAVLAVVFLCGRV